MLYSTPSDIDEVITPFAFLPLSDTGIPLQPSLIDVRTAVTDLINSMSEVKLDLIIELIENSYKSSNLSLKSFLSSDNDC